MFLAKALLDNVAERPEELAFRRGDVVTVMMMQDAGHRATLGGWWLCSFRGHQGIVPANRLKILSGLMVEEEEEEEEAESAGSSEKKGMERTHTNTHQYQQSTNCVQDYDVPPSRYPPSHTQPPSPADSALYDIPPHLSATASDTTFHPHSSPDKSSKTFDSKPSEVYDSPPSNKQSFTNRRLPWGSCTSVDNLVSSSFQALSVSGDQREKLIHKAPPSRKRWSAESGSLMLSENGGVRMWRQNTKHVRFSGETGNTKLPDCHRCEIPLVTQQAFVRNRLHEDQSMYSTSSHRKPAESSGEGIYDIPNPLTRDLSHACTKRRTGGMRQLRGLSSESCISDTFSRPVSSQDSVAGAASLTGSFVPGTEVSLSKTSGLPPTKSCPSRPLSLNAGLESCHGISAPYRVSSSIAGTLRPLSDSFHDNSKTNHNLECTLNSHPHYASLVSTKTAKSDCVSASPATNYTSPVYDIPPQISRHSMTSASSICSDESFRLSSSSMDSTSSGAEYYCLTEGMYDELQLDQDSATKLLVKLQDDVTKSVSQVVKSLSFFWHTERSPQSNLFDVKTAFTELKNTVTQLVEFAQGTLANSSQLSDRKLVSQFVKQVHLLRRHLRAVSETLVYLENVKWQVPQWAEPLKHDRQDHVDRITRLTKDLIPEVTKLVSFIRAKNSFERSCGSTVLPNDLQVDQETSTLRLRQSEAVTTRSAYVQSRPLPPLPASVSGKQLSPTSVVQTLPRRLMTSSQSNLEDKVMVTEKSTQWCNMGDSHNDSAGGYSDTQEDYDYVQLETCDSGVQIKSLQQKRSEHKQRLLNNIDEETECPDTFRTSTNPSFVAEEKKARKEKSAKLVTRLIHSTEKMLAYLGTKHPNSDKAPTKKITKSISSCKIHPNGLLKPEAHSQELRTSTCNVNKPGTSVQSPPSHGLCITNKTLDAGEKQVLCYYSKQLESHCTQLSSAVDTLMACIEDNQPPKVFVSNGRFVIVTAYKLIYMGDALLRRLVNAELREQVLRCAGQVCECLKVCVLATKTAALQFPSVTAVQHMVDRVVDVLHAAHELRMIVSQAAAL